MGIKDIIKKSFLEGYATSDIQLSTIFICMLCTAAIAVYIFIIYKSLNKNSFYNKNFNISLMGMAVITAAIILTIQSNIVVSLGMVGALSIVRFRTAIKDPMDLIFLFWAISVGIICGAGFAMIAVIASVVFTIILVLFSLSPAAKGNLVLVINAASHKDENDIMEIVKAFCPYNKIRARNVSKSGMNLAIEIKAEDPSGLISRLMALECISSASLVEHDGEITV
ncbi:MAG: DUF4956 domain-containing protein [Oscillospiraceae bacterium]|nr:DUF4956 domain-containing protein [Oscillospiraceae bacterium]